MSLKEKFLECVEKKAIEKIKKHELRTAEYILAIGRALSERIEDIEPDQISTALLEEQGKFIRKDLADPSREIYADFARMEIIDAIKDLIL